ncbi:MAG TPA: hypothetical protein VMT76_17205 [Puia sp.]|nr:hypothetical protein [Puia sp.]
MKLIPIFLLVALVGLGGCSSSYKTAQTPDDVYYSPGKQYVAHNTYRNSNDDDYYYGSNNNNGEYYNANPNDQYLMMKVQDPSRWSTFDDYGYDAFYYPYSSVGLGFGYMNYYSGMYSPWGSLGFWNPYYGWNSYYAWNAFYNPYYYYGNVAYVGGKSSAYNTYSGLHPFNSAAYRNNVYSNANAVYNSNNNSYNRNNNSFNNNNLRRSYYNNQNSNNYNNNFNNNRSFSQPSRSYTPSSSGGGGGGSRSSGGGGGGFSRPGRP